MRLNLLTYFITFIALLCSCNNESEDFDISPISMSAETASSFSRAVLSTGMHDNFKVFVAVDIAGVRSPLITGYEVRYVGDRWSYVSPDQPYTYWVGSADRHLFVAGAPFDAVSSLSSSAMTIHLENNTESCVLASQPLQISRDAPEYGRVVDLHFGFSHCRVCVAFVKNSSSDVAISDVTLTPDEPIASKANMTYTYDWSTDTPTAAQSLTDVVTSAESFAFADVTIPAESSDAVLSATRYYCVPDASNPVGWSVSLVCDGENRSASFVNTATWESGKSYTYIFTLSGKTPKLVKVVSQDMFFDCNDIIPGGEFSDSDMTETDTNDSSL